MNIPRNEYPRPQMVRDNWINLNGKWDFEIDNAKVGQEKEFYKRDKLKDSIIVPFCPESKLSGVNNTDFMNCVWYRRNIEVGSHGDKRVILHFGAVDYHAVLYVNGEYAGEHKGGYTSFSFDITDLLQPDENYISLCVYDDVRSNNQPAGKQCTELKSHGCYYTRTTGIWQTVWIEYVDAHYITSVKTTTDIQKPSVTFEVEFSDNCDGYSLSANISLEGRNAGNCSAEIVGRVCTVTAELSERKLWEPGNGNLYDVAFELKQSGEVSDRVVSYFGLRTVSLNGRTFQINGKTVFGRWVLDQGFYPDGIYTAPTDEDLKNDIIYSMQLGFNGARLHEKIFEPRFLYWADKLGYLVWEEHANWQLNITEMGQIQYFLPEWIEAVKRDYNHPSIIGWCPFNETWDFEGRKQCDDVVRTVYTVTKALDNTRPVIDTSGNFHTITDIFDVHDYEQEPAVFKSHYEKLTDGILEDSTYRTPAWSGRQEYDGLQPTFVSEYGGIRWAPEKDGGWGYGNAPKTEAEFIERYKGLTEALLNNQYMLGFCYTQLYDVEQEQNGIMTYDRRFKFDPKIIKKINIQTAKIEKSDE